jgi:hypothetical protein
MSTTNTNSTIDDKKEDQKSAISGNFSENVKNFVTSVVYTVIHMVVYFSVSGLILYDCKLAQSNILPTDMHCKPYTEGKPTITQINANIFSPFNQPNLSMKISFPYDKYNASNKILDTFTEYKNSPDSNFLANYFISIFESLINVNYSLFNGSLSMLNEIFPEFMLVLFGPIIFVLLMILAFFQGYVYLIYLWLVNLSWFFKTNTNETGAGKPVWEDTESNILPACLAIAFVFILFMAMPLLAIIVIITILWTAFSLMAYKATLNGKRVSSSAVVLDVFKYYKLLIGGLFSLIVISKAFSQLGTVSGVVAVCVFLMIYFGVISNDIFNPIKQDHLTPATTYEQADKSCKFIPTSNYKSTKEKENKWLFFGGGKEKDCNCSITKQLKFINKLISK